MENNKIGILLLNYNSCQETLEFARKIVDLLSLSWKDIIIVDNCSTDDSRDVLLKESNVGYVLLQSNNNKGYAAGNNIGLKYAYTNGYKYIVIVNNDIIISDNDFILKMLKGFTEKNVAIVNPDIYDVNNRLYNRDSCRPSFFDYTIGIFNYQKKGRKLNKNKEYEYVYRPQGCCMMVDMDKINSIGYFDENTFLYYEESILAEKLLNKNYKCCCCVSTRVIHNHSKVIRKTFNKINIIKINNQSFKYYLSEYRKFNNIEIIICLVFNTMKLLFI